MTIWVVPPALEDAVYAATAAVVPGIDLMPSRIARWVTDRSRRYTSARDVEPMAADEDGATAPAGGGLAHDPSDADLIARAVFFTIADAMKIAIPLGELAARGALPAGRRVVDLGAGCGAMSLGLLASLAGDAAPLSITAIDRDHRALAIAARAIRAFAPTATVETRVADIGAPALAIPPADLIVAGTLLNELPEPARAALVDRALAALAPDGALILVEPALRETSRALHALRDAVLARGAAHVFAPCTRTGPCPALLDPRDWCHEDRGLQLPPRTAQLARATHLRDGGMRFSYLVLRRAPAPALADDRAHTWRLVSAPHVQKGKHETIGCSEHGRVTLRLLKRNRTSATKIFEDGRRGDLVTTDAEPNDRVELLATSHIALTTLKP